MSNKLVNNFLKITNTILICVIMSYLYPIYSQSKTLGNTFIHGPRETAVFRAHHFINGGSGVLPGIVGTKRNIPTYFSFAGTSSVAVVSDAAHVDGYVKNYVNQNFTFPVGDNGVYGPVTMMAASPLNVTNPISAAYFFTNPDNAITTSLLGGDEPPLPLGGPFNRSLRETGISAVSSIEYWDVDGSVPTRLSFHWRSVSQIATLTNAMLMGLRIVGWNGSQWVDIPSTIDAGANLTSGSLTTTAAIIPNTYTAYTFAVSCDLINITFSGIPDDLYLCKNEIKTIDVNVMLDGAAYIPDFTLERFDGNTWIDVDGPNTSGIFNIFGLPDNAPEVKYRVRINFGTCVRWSNEFILHSYKPNSIACLGTINVSADRNCEVYVDPKLFLIDNINDSEFYEVLITDINGTVVNNPIKKVIGKQKYKVSIKEKCSNNSCWGYMIVEDKLPPIIENCFENQIFACHELDAVRNEKPRDHFSNPSMHVVSRPPFVYENCVVFQADFKDVETIKVCGETEITRSWIFKDQFGNESNCKQVFKFSPLKLSDLKEPLAKVIIDCNSKFEPTDIQLLFDNRNTLGSLKSKWVVENNEGSVYGGFTYLAKGLDGALHAQLIDYKTCNIITKHSDEVIVINENGCEKERKIIRKWTILDDCTNEFKFFNQIIILRDTTGPNFNVVSIETSLQAHECSLNLKVPSPSQITDNCSDVSKLKWYVIPPGGLSVSGLQPEYVVQGFTKGNHTLTYIVEDCNGNKTKKDININVKDITPPVAIVKSKIVLSLTSSSSVKGYAALKAKDVDNGSYDNCGNVYLEVRREDMAPHCLNLGNTTVEGLPWNNNITYNGNINGLDQNVPLHLNDSILDTDKGQFVNFCCEDVGKEVKVWLRVWDDASCDGIFGNMGDNFNETWTTVSVEDKITPKISCSPDVILNCENDNSKITEFNIQSTTGPFSDVKGKVSKALLPEVMGVCGGYELEFRDIGSLNSCNIGSFTRTYRVKNFPSVTCTQIITLSGLVQKPILEHPISLHIWNKCTLTEADVLENTVRLSPLVRADMYKGCDKYNLNEPATNSTMATSEKMAATSNGFTPTSGPLAENLRSQARFNTNYKNVGCSVFGKKLLIEEYNIGDGCKKWLVRWDYINWCDNSNAGCRETIYKFEDTTAPVITKCVDTDIEIESSSCTLPISLSPSAIDELCDDGQALIWRARIYEGQNIGNIPVTSPIREIVNLKGSNPVFIFNGIGLKAPLTPGLYTVRYSVKDDCGNLSECNANITIRAKAVTPYCISLSSAVMKNGLVELWAKDFDKGSFTNCGTGVMLFTFNRGGQAEHPSVDQNHLTFEHYFTGFGNFLAMKTVSGTSSGEEAAKKLYEEGKAQLWYPQVKVTQRPTLPNGTVQPNLRELLGGTSGMNFGCKAGNRIGQPINAEMRVWDLRSFKSGTTQGSDFCSTRLTLIDNQGGCGVGSLVSISGSIATAASLVMQEVEVILKADLPEFPIVSTTNKEGNYVFTNMPIGVNYAMTPKKDTDHINGVNTLDLVQIQRHILGIKKLDSPYKLIAADANGDQTIRVSDIVEIRKLVLGMATKFENMPSWIFVDGKYSITNSPWPFKDEISHTSLTTSSTNNNFIGVKIGDVDGTASANLTSIFTQPRSAGLRLSVEDRAMKAGEEIEISLTAEQFNEVHGMQLTLSHEGMELVSIDGRAIEMTADHIGKISKVKTTMSWASANGTTVAQGSEVMRMKFRATKDQQLSNALQITSEVTGAEAYIGTKMERTTIILEMRKDIRPNVFKLSQNEPNPWKASTMINYTLPQSGAVKLTLMDAYGRIIRTYASNEEAGENVFRITREQLNGARGTVIYKIESGNYSEQRKMIVIE